MTPQDIISAWIRIREIDQTIPDEVLDFMKDSAIEKLGRPSLRWWDEELTMSDKTRLAKKHFLKDFERLEDHEIEIIYQFEIKKEITL